MDDAKIGHWEAILRLSSSSSSMAWLLKLYKT